MKVYMSCKNNFKNAPRFKLNKTIQKKTKKIPANNKKACSPEFWWWWWGGGGGGRGRGWGIRKGANGHNSGLDVVTLKTNLDLPHRMFYQSQTHDSHRF